MSGGRVLLWTLSDPEFDRRIAEKKQKELSTLWKEAMEYQRNGDLRSYAKIVKKIEGVENELVEMMNGA